MYSNTCYGDNRIMYSIPQFFHACSRSFHRNFCNSQFVVRASTAKSPRELDGDYCDSHHFPNNVLSVHLCDRAINGNLFTLN